MIVKSIHKKWLHLGLIGLWNRYWLVIVKTHGEAKIWPRNKLQNRLCEGVQGKSNGLSTGKKKKKKSDPGGFVNNLKFGNIETYMC